jgi:hypothetical protein
MSAIRTTAQLLAEYDSHLLYWREKLKESNLTTERRKMYLRTINDLERDKESLIKRIVIWNETELI